LAVFLTIFLLSLAGFPGTGGFMGKIYLLQGAVDAGLWTLSVILVLTTVVSYYYYLRVAWFAWMRDPLEEGQHDGIRVPAALRFAMAAGVVVVLYLGVFPSTTMELARSSVEGLTTMGSLLVGIGGG
jgi:NADH-quinone oxidoreductase subunit N